MSEVGYFKVDNIEGDTGIVHAKALAGNKEEDLLVIKGDLYITIFVKLVNGKTNKESNISEFRVKLTNKISTLIKVLETTLDSEIELVYKGHTLNDQKTFAEYKFT